MRVADRMQHIYEATAREYADIVARARTPHFLVLAKWLALQAGEEVVDLGCGPGNLARELSDAGARMTGVDASQAMIERASAEFPSHRWRVGSATDTGLPASAFDVVTTSHLLPWLPEPESLLREAFRLSKPGARLGIVTAASSTYREFFQALEKLLRTYEQYYQTDAVSQVWGSRVYTPQQLQRHVGAAGFSDARWLVLNVEVPVTATEYLAFIRMFSGDHYLYPIPDEYREEAKGRLHGYLDREGLTLNERATVLLASKP